MTTQRMHCFDCRLLKIGIILKLCGPIWLCRVSAN